MDLAWLGEKYPTVRVAAACNLGHSSVRVAAASVVVVVVPVLVVAVVASVVDVAWLTLGWLPSCPSHTYCTCSAMPAPGESDEL